LAYTQKCHRTDLYGLIDEGTGLRATFTVGLRVHKPRRRSMVKTKGELIDEARASDEMMSLRVRQVGTHAAGSTMTRCEGRTGKWGAEPTLVCEVEHVPSARERRETTFKKHMFSLAEQAAERFGQEEVWLRMDQRLYRANAPGEKAPQALRKGARVIR
jgi:hypothetical protein